jgi:cytoskeletal protein RodZ
MSDPLPDEPVEPMATGIFHYQELIESRLGQPIAAEILAAEAERATLSPGAQLATARNALGWTVEQVASQLKLAKRQIVAIEADDLASLPEPAVVRGFIRAYAKLLKLDAAPLLALIDSGRKKTELEKTEKTENLHSSLPTKMLGFVLIFLLVFLLCYSLFWRS